MAEFIRMLGLCQFLAATSNPLLIRAAPTSVLAFMVGGLWYRFMDVPWRKLLQAGL
jgi:hypothetical protein